MLEVHTFDNRAGGNVLYKALAHPLAAEQLNQLFARIADIKDYGVVDLDGSLTGLAALYPTMPAASSLYVQATERVGSRVCGLDAEPITALGSRRHSAVLVAAFGQASWAERIQHLVGAETPVFTLDVAKLPEHLQTDRKNYLSKLNFATNFAFFRNENGLSTRVVTANYWAGYGARDVRLWLRLFGAGGNVLATWEESLPAGPGGIWIDSAEVRRRFDLPEFTGQLFMHAVGVAGHDVVKYALDTWGSGNATTLSCTHDANAWPSSRYAGIPAPQADERVILWVQNSHARPIPLGELQLDRMGRDQPVPIRAEIAPFASLELDVAEWLPDLAWPAQVEFRAGRHVVRPRYEVQRRGRTRIAHANVERADLQPDPGIPHLAPELGRGYLLPLAVLPTDRFHTVVLPTPMAEAQSELPIRADIFDRLGVQVASRFLGCLPRDHATVLDLDLVVSPEALAKGGHVDLVYDFRDGGSADGWLHALIRVRHRESGHEAESSFGAHIFNTIMTYRDEPQSYSGPPPGLTTRLFLRLGSEIGRSFAVLIYPSSATWNARSDTQLLLHNGDGELIAEASLTIACGGSVLVYPDEHFRPDLIAAATPRGYVIVRDRTCRLFGYAGLMDARAGFSFDHMFGF